MITRSILLTILLESALLALTSSSALPCKATVGTPSKTMAVDTPTWQFNDTVKFILKVNNDFKTKFGGDLNSYLTSPRGFPDSFVPKGEIICATNEMVNVVHHGNSSVHAPLNPGTIQFTVKSYQDLKDAYEQGGCSHVPGLVVHYGFNTTTKQLECAFSFVCMELDHDIGPYTIPDTPLYVLNGSWELADAGMTLTQWRADKGKKFQDNVVVDQYDNDKFHYIYKGIFSHAIYKLGRIDALIADNKLKDTDWVEVVPVAEPEKWSSANRGAEFALRTCLVAKNGTGRLLTDDAVHSGLFENRGADLGSACPPTCSGIAVFEGHGIDVRKGCP